MVARILLALLIFLPTASLAGTIRSDVKDEKYIEYGEKHKCVLKLETEIEILDGRKLKNYGCCTMIKPKVAITAAHVIRGTDGYIVKDDGERVKIRWSAFPAEHKMDKVSEKWDIAVCYLEKPIELEYYPELYREYDEEQKLCSIAGFGATGTHDTGVTIRKSQKRAGSNVVEAILNGMLICGVGEKRLTSLEYLIASGDSGGGLFIDKKLAGINSNVCTVYEDKKADSDKNDWSCHTRVSQHVKWIDKIVEVFEQIEKEGGVK